MNFQRIFDVWNLWVPGLWACLAFEAPCRRGRRSYRDWRSCADGGRSAENIKESATKNTYTIIIQNIKEDFKEISNLSVFPVIFGIYPRFERNLKSWTRTFFEVQELTIPGGAGTSRYVAREPRKKHPRRCGELCGLWDDLDVIQMRSMRSMSDVSCNENSASQLSTLQREAPEVQDESGTAQTQGHNGHGVWRSPCVHQTCPNLQGDVVAQLADRADRRWIQLYITS